MHQIMNSKDQDEAILTQGRGVRVTLRLWSGVRGGSCVIAQGKGVADFSLRGGWFP